MKYNDEEDKCYGIAGMAIGITIWNRENLLYKLDLDDENESVAFTSEFYFAGNPAVNPKASWHQMLDHYRITVGMLIANLLCRSIHNSKFNYTKIKKLLYKPLAEEGKQSCQLEDDEIRTLFESTYNYLENIFRNRSVQAIASDFANTLRKRRSLSCYEVKELLSMLGQI